MELTLYTAKNSRGLLIEWLLEEIGEPYQRKVLDLSTAEHKQEAYRAIHPLGVVPALVVDGQPLIESLAISLFLADAFPAANLAPDLSSPERGAYYQWMVYATATVEPCLATPFIRGLKSSTEDRASCATDDECAAFAAVLAPVEQGMKRGRLLESGSSAADIVLATELYWANQVGLLAKSKVAMNFLSTITERASFRQVLSRSEET